MSALMAASALYGSGLLDVDATAVCYMLARPNAGSYAYEADYVNNVRVRHLDVSAQEPAATLLFAFGRRTVASSPAGTEVWSNYLPRFTGNDSFYDENDQPSYSALATAPSVGLNQTLGQYYISGGTVLQLDFYEPVECLRHPTTESSWSQAFAFVAQRVDADASTATNFNVNIWFEEY